jgi:hypothetical protein
MSLQCQCSHSSSICDLDADIEVHKGSSNRVALLIFSDTNRDPAMRELSVKLLAKRIYNRPEIGGVLFKHFAELRVAWRRTSFLRSFSSSEGILAY